MILGHLLQSHQFGLCVGQISRSIIVDLLQLVDFPDVHHPIRVAETVLLYLSDVRLVRFDDFLMLLGERPVLFDHVLLSLYYLIPYALVLGFEILVQFGDSLLLF